MTASPPFSYTLQATEQTGMDTIARAGVFNTPHGPVETPVFMPVGTHSAVKTLAWGQVKDLGASMVLCNSYHLYLRPGPDLIEKAGGLHHWMNWDQPILTDSGGFQVFSLSKFREIKEDGVRFKDPLSGNYHFIGPKESMMIQNKLGPDVMMAFDECPPYPATYEYAQKSLEITNRWLETCFEHHARPHDQALFPIIQGSTYPDLREASAAFAQQFDAYGYAIGGVSVGEPRHEINRIVEITAPMLPTDKPRYLMGVGTPEDLLDCIRRGMDMFDCVMPTRIARHGSFFTPDGRGIIKNAQYTEDFAPLVEGCECYACENHSRAYIRHLFRQKEWTASMLMSIHNIFSLVQLAKDARQAILAGTFEDFYHTRMERLRLGEAERLGADALRPS